MGILACQSLRSVFCLSVWPWEVGTARALPLAHSSPHSRSPPMRPPCWVFIPSALLSHWGGFPGQDMASGPAGCPGPHAHSQQHTTPSGARGPSPRLPWPRANTTTFPLPYPLPHALLAPLNVASSEQSGLHSHLQEACGWYWAVTFTPALSISEPQSVLAPGLCRFHQGTQRGCQVTCRQGSRAACLHHVQGSRAVCRGHVQRVTCRSHVQRVCVT